MTTVEELAVRLDEADERIAAQRQKLVRVEDRIARAMAARVDEQEKLARLLERREKLAEKYKRAAVDDLKFPGGNP